MKNPYLHYKFHSLQEGYCLGILEVGPDRFVQWHIRVRQQVGQGLGTERIGVGLVWQGGAYLV
jgi:hypothetical protein